MENVIQLRRRRKLTFKQKLGLKIIKTIESFEKIYGNLNDYFFGDRKAPFSETAWFYIPLALISPMIPIFFVLNLI